MNLPELLVKIVIALACAGIAGVLVPRRIPGKFVGLIVIGFAGVWLGEWAYRLMRQQYGLDHEVLRWHVEGVLIVPAIVGSTIILYVVTTFLKWGKYGE